MSAIKKRFTIFPDEHGNGEWISLTDFVQHLRHRLKDTDQQKAIKLSNIKRELCGQHNSVKTIDSRECVSVLGVTRYMFHHADDIEECRSFSLEIIKCDLSQKKTAHISPVYTETVFDLYKIIATKKLRKCPSVSILTDSVQLDETKIPTLLEIHKTHFSEGEWREICVFEWHFGQTLNSNQDLSPDELLQAKCQYYHVCQTASFFADQCHIRAKGVISHRHTRKRVAELEKRIEFVKGETRHLPTIIDVQLLDCLRRQFSDKVTHVICVDSSCAADLTISVYVELSSQDISVTDDISHTIAYIVSTKHGLSCSQVLFFDPGAFDGYIRANDEVARFTLHDMVITRKLSHQIWYESPQRVSPT